MRYGEACIAMIGKVGLAGQMCIKNIDYRIKNGLFRSSTARAMCPLLT